MMSLKEMFYGEPEQVWVVKAEEKKKDDKKPAQETKPAEPTPLENAFGRFYPYYNPPLPAPPAAPKKSPTEVKLEFKVPVCCGQCVDIVTSEIKDIKGVKTVTCDIRNEKVTVVAATDVKVENVLLVITALPSFKKSRLWTADD